MFFLSGVDKSVSYYFPGLGSGLQFVDSAVPSSDC